MNSYIISKKLLELLTHQEWILFSFKSMFLEERDIFDSGTCNLLGNIDLTYKGMQHFALGRRNKMSTVHKNSCDKVREVNMIASCLRNPRNAIASLLLLGNWGPSMTHCVLQVYRVACLRHMTHRHDLIPDRDVPSLTTPCMNRRPIASHTTRPLIFSW